MEARARPPVPATAPRRGTQIEAARRTHAGAPGSSRRAGGPHLVEQLDMEPMRSNFAGSPTDSIFAPPPAGPGPRPPGSVGEDARTRRSRAELAPVTPSVTGLWSLRLGHCAVGHCAFGHIVGRVTRCVSDGAFSLLSDLPRGLPCDRSLGPAEGLIMLPPGWSAPGREPRASRGIIISLGEGLCWARMSRSRTGTAGSRTRVGVNGAPARNVAAARAASLR